MASDLFYTAFITGGSSSVECTCGRLYYSTKMDEEDVVFFEKQNASNPDKYIPVEYGSIECCELAGRVYVCECVCKGLDPYEAFIWEHRARITKYINERATKEYEAAILAKEQADAAIKMHTSARDVAHALERAQRKLADAQDYF